MDKLFELLIDALSLTIGLWVVGSQSSRLNTNKAPQFSGKLCDKLWAMVGDVLPRSLVVPPHIPVVQSGGSNSTKAGVALIEVGPLTEDVNHDHDRVEPGRQ
jgi:hypothetical protein